MRGYMGAFGGLGVFTKCAVALFPWPGDSEHRTKGKAPIYEPEIPEGLKGYFLGFPSYGKMFEAVRLIGEAEIAYAVDRRPASWLAMSITKSNQEYWELWQKWQKELLKERYIHNLELLLKAHSPRQMEYNEKCLEKILEKTGGWVATELMEDRRAVDSNYLHHIWMDRVAAAIFRAAGQFAEGRCCSLGQGSQ